MVKHTVYLLVFAVAVIAVISIFRFAGVIKNTSKTNAATTAAAQLSTTATSIAYTTIPVILKNTTSATSSTAITSTATTTIPTYCRSNRSSVLVYNGNFATGTYYGWNVNGTGFGSAPLNITWADRAGYYYGYPWVGYSGQFAATTYSQSSLPTPGTISANFVAVLPYLNFQIYSPQNSQLYVELISASGLVIIRHYNTLQGQGKTDQFTYAGIDMSSMMCQSVTLKVVANVVGVTASDQNQFIAVGNFYQGQYLTQTYGIEVNSTA